MGRVLSWVKMTNFAAHPEHVIIILQGTRLHFESEGQNFFVDICTKEIYSIIRQMCHIDKTKQKIKIAAFNCRKIVLSCNIKFDR